MMHLKTDYNQRSPVRSPFVQKSLHNCFPTTICLKFVTKMKENAELSRSLLSSECSFVRSQRGLKGLPGS